MQGSRRTHAEGLEAGARRRRLGNLVLTIFAALSCSDGLGTPRPDESIPPSSTPFIAAVNARVSPDPIVYISLPPGAIVGGDRAILNIQRTGSSTQTTLIDGGFDPVPLRALPGDVITIIVDLGAGSGTASYSIVVPKPSRPVVVRTKPTKQKRDVPLNASMMVVFSEPIDESTLTDAGVHLMRDSASVKGHLEFADETQLVAIFTPESALAAGSDYTLVISQAIHDLDGSALDNTVSVPFTTVEPTPPAGLPSLVFTVQPTTQYIGGSITPDVQISVVDGTGRVMTEYAGYMRIRLGNRQNASDSTSGGVALNHGGGGPFESGVATFRMLSVNAIGTGYTLVAESEGTVSATSVPFDVSDLPPLGALAISVTTSGTGQPTAYFVSVDNGAPRSIGVNASITVPDLSRSTHNVSLTGFGSNCMVTGEAFVTAAVIAYQTTDVRFSVTCGTAGSIRVTTTTTGTDPDPGGYALGLNVGGMSTMAALPASGTIVVNLARVGAYVIKLSGVAENCRVAGGAVRQVDVRAEEIAEITFDVSCDPVTQLAFVRDGQIYLVNSNATGLAQLTHTEVGVWNSEPAWSPDGTRIAFSRQKDYGSDIYLMDADGANVVQRTSTGGYSVSPTWSPDGRKIAFAALADGSLDVYVMSAVDDGAPAQRITNRPGYDGEPSWSPDGRRILFISDWRAYDFVRDLYAVDAADGANVTVLAEGPFFSPNVVLLFDPEWSADVNRIAIIECSAGYYDCETSAVAILQANGSNRVAVSTGKFFFGPTWSPGGGTIAFAGRGCPECASSIRYVRADGSHEDTIVDNGYSAAWRPRR
jgi:hypothetical protein